MRTMLLRKQIINSGSCQRKKTETKKREIHVFNKAGLCRSVMGFSNMGDKRIHCRKMRFRDKEVGSSVSRKTCPVLSQSKREKEINKEKAKLCFHSEKQASSAVLKSLCRCQQACLLKAGLLGRTSMLSH